MLAIEVRHRIPILLDIFRSDHAPFWAAGIPAIMITDTANFRNPHYHNSTDTLDYTFMGNVTRAWSLPWPSTGPFFTLSIEPRLLEEPVVEEPGLISRVKVVKPLVGTC